MEDTPPTALPSTGDSAEYFRPVERRQGHVIVPDRIWELPDYLRLGKTRIPRGEYVGLFAALCVLANKKRNGWVRADQLHDYLQTWATRPDLSEQQLAEVCRFFVRHGLVESRKRGNA